jgi:hypothetical protein
VSVRVYEQMLQLYPDERRQKKVLERKKKEKKRKKEKKMAWAFIYWPI